MPKTLYWEFLFQLQCNLHLVTLNLVTTCDLVTIFQRPFFNLLYKIIQFSDIMRFNNSLFWRPKVSLNQDCTVCTLGLTHLIDGFGFYLSETLVWKVQLYYNLGHLTYHNEVKSKLKVEYFIPIFMLYLHIFEIFDSRRLSLYLPICTWLFKISILWNWFLNLIFYLDFLSISNLIFKNIWLHCFRDFLINVLGSKQY